MGNCPLLIILNYLRGNTRMELAYNISTQLTLLIIFVLFLGGCGIMTQILYNLAVTYINKKHRGK